MKKRDELIDAVRAILSKAEFDLSERHAVESICFDIVARRDELILIIKVLVNIDSLKRETTEELRILATTLNASPMIIGFGCGAGKLEHGSIYSRFMVPIMTRDTLYDFFIEDVPPFIFAAPGGFYVRLDGDLLRHMRGARNISLGTLADIAGVSRRTIQLYCEGAGATIDAAMKIEKFLGIPLIIPLDPFKYTRSTVEALRDIDKLDAMEKDIFNQLKGLGYDVLPTLKCPFEALTRDRRNLFLTGVGRENRILVAKARSISSISAIVRKQSVIFVEKHRKYRENIEGAPLIGRDELRTIRDGDRILTLIAERRKEK
jgi:putative transcriptional regulator